MPAKEIKELRKAGKLDEAYVMAKAELDSDPENIWTKRNMSWVIYSQLDATAENLSLFLSKLAELKQLNLPNTEEMLFENLAIVISKAARTVSKVTPPNLNSLHELFDAIMHLPLKGDSKWFSVLYGAFHKGLKDSPRYLEFADWWNFENFRPEDYEKEKLPNGKEVMSLAEQAYIAYAKHLLPKHSPNREQIFDRSKAEVFLPKLTEVVESYSHYQYPPYFLAKLLMALGEKENILSALLPFARKKRNDFWVWQVLGEAFSNEPDNEFACYCRALLCQSPEEMLVGLRQKMAKLFISKKLFNEAKTEIEWLINVRNAHEYRIPAEVSLWQSQEWYSNAIAKESNDNLYNQYAPAAEALLYHDTPEELVIVEFVNSDKKVLNFIASEAKFGFFKYDRFMRDVKVGDILKVRFQGGSNEGIYQVYTAVKTEDENFKKSFLKTIEGNLKILPGKSFGFLGDVFVHPSIVTKQNLTDGRHLKADVIKSYNREKKQWGWKVLGVLT